MSAAPSSYSRTAITLHWLIALLLIGNFVGGLLLEDLFNATDPATRKLGFTVVQLHKSFGLTILLLSLLRLGVRLVAGAPPLPDHMTPMERLLSKLTHWGFYAVMILVPLTGWLMVSASPLGFPTVWFGLFEWPNLPVGTSKALSGAAGEAHEVGGAAELLQAGIVLEERLEGDRGGRGDGPAHDGDACGCHGGGGPGGGRHRAPCGR